MGMTEDELITKLESEETRALGYLSGDLSEEREENVRLYMGEKFGDISAVEGRSSIVSMDVQEGIESVMPMLMKVFAGGDEICRFEPVGPEDVEPAKQETAAVNHVALNQNNGYLVMYQWFKSALLTKNAYVKYYYDKKEEVSEEQYEGLSDDELQLLLQNPGVEPIAHEAAINEYGEPVHAIRVRVKNVEGRVVITPVPCEEILVNVDAIDVNPSNCGFFQHRSLKTISELREMGYDVPDDLQSDDGTLVYTPERQSREQFSEESWGVDEETGPNRKVLYKESYYRVDYDGDGISELRMICTVGREVLNNEVVDDVPFACITPFLMPHKHYGMALADFLKDIMVIKTTVLRNVLDNFYHANNTRYAISDRVSLDDMLVSRPGGIVRVDGEPAGAIMPMGATPIAAQAFPLMEYLDEIKAERTGVTKYSQGMDANSLNKTATGISKIMGASQLRLELIARTFAETGIKRLFLGIHKLLQQHSHKPLTMRLNGKYTPVDPRQWKTRTDMTVSVGLGTGDKDQQLMHIQTILTVQKEAMLGGMPFVTPQNLYESCMELARNAGFKDADKYFTNPQEAPPAPPRPSPEELKMQAEQQKAQAQMELEQQKMQMEQQKSVAQFGLEKEKTQAQMELEVWKAQQQAEIERYKAEIKAQSDYELQQAKLQIQAHTEVTKMEMDNHRAQLGQMHEMQMSQREADDAKEAGKEEREMKLLETVAKLAESLNKPKKVVRDANGRVAGVE